jgi:hypothetical protein
MLTFQTVEISSRVVQPGGTREGRRWGVEEVHSNLEVSVIRADAVEDPVRA